MKVPLHPQRMQPPTEQFTLPSLGGYGWAQTLTMTPEQIQEALERDTKRAAGTIPPLGFGKQTVEK